MLWLDWIKDALCCIVVTNQVTEASVVQSVQEEEERVVGGTYQVCDMLQGVHSQLPVSFILGVLGQREPFQGKRSSFGNVGLSSGT